MLEKTAALCVVALVALIAVPLSDRTQSVRAKQQSLGLFDLWQAEARVRQLDKVSAARNEFWDTRDAIAVEVLHGKVDLRTAADRLRVEGEARSTVFRYDDNWENNSVRAHARNLVGALAYRLQGGVLGAEHRNTIQRLQEEVELLPNEAE